MLIRACACRYSYEKCGNKDVFTEIACPQLRTKAACIEPCTWEAGVCKDPTIPRFAAKHLIISCEDYWSQVYREGVETMGSNLRTDARLRGCNARPRGCHPGAYSSQGCCPNTLLASMPAVTAPVGAVRTMCPNAGWLTPAQAQPYIADARLSRLRTRQSVLRRPTAREMGTARPQGSRTVRAET